MVFRTEQVLILITLMILCGVGNGEKSSSPAAAMYWKKVLPNTPMPQTLREGLMEEDHKSTSMSDQTGKKHKPIYETFGVHISYTNAASQAQLHDLTKALFFLPKDLRSGSKLTLRFTRSTDGTSNAAPLLSRIVAASVPFSAEKFPMILDRFSIAPKSEVAKTLKQTIDKCEKKQTIEDKYCATSLVSMVDFAMAKLGNQVKAVGTKMTMGAAPANQQTYTVVATKKVITGSKLGGEMVACHTESYLYSVYYCHMTKNSVAYTVSLVGENGVRVEAAAVCHLDTSAWNPDHLAFHILKVKPGTVPVCHFMAKDGIIWV